jgi:hypothetical protein
MSMLLGSFSYADVPRSGAKFLNCVHTGQYPANAHDPEYGVELFCVKEMFPLRRRSSLFAKTFYHR